MAIGQRKNGDKRKYLNLRETIDLKAWVDRNMEVMQREDPVICRYHNSWTEPMAAEAATGELGFEVTDNHLRRIREEYYGQLYVRPQPEKQTKILETDFESRVKFLEDSLVKAVNAQGQMSEIIGALTSRFTLLEGSLNGLIRRVDAVGPRMDSIDKETQRVASEFDTLQDELAQMERKISALYDAAKTAGVDMSVLDGKYRVVRGERVTPA